MSLPLDRIVAIMPPRGYQGACVVVIVAHDSRFFSFGVYGASAFMAEYAARQKGFYTSIVPANYSHRLILGSLIAAMTAFMDADFGTNLGWRIPLGLAAPLGLVGRYMRLNLENPGF